MNAELIAVGTELLLGDTINTDAAAVARLLSELGINVYCRPLSAITARGSSRRCSLPAPAPTSSSRPAASARHATT